MGIEVSPTDRDARAQVLGRYEQRIAYYWKVSRRNSQAYKRTRYLLTILGALLTLISSLSSANFVTGGLAVAFAVLTPLLASGMAMIGGVSQAFQWGGAWSDSVVTAMRLEKERDRVAVTPSGDVDAVREMALIDDLVLAETQGFFQRLFGSGSAFSKAESPASVR
ncbi:MAG TPA: SLATT domain-containing protein [Bryobacteraceae bacterium]|jgi:hypothetical protein|nr:SLATT domain-containing protein [Bryobacteraceae bacterium]